MVCLRVHIGRARYRCEYYIDASSRSILIATCYNFFQCFYPIKKNCKNEKGKKKIREERLDGGVLFFMVVEPTDFGEEYQQVILRGSSMHLKSCQELERNLYY